MSLLCRLTVNIIGTLLRILPMPCPTGVFKIGNPDTTSPVLLTGNYRLTVHRVRRALRGTDCYLLVANSRGINVWCAATGGLLTNHDVISVLKTSGVHERVNHRRVILPQLAAAGVMSGTIHEKTGWRVIWGPVYARDIPAFLSADFKKTRDMSRVNFLWDQRLEMASAWAFPISLVAALLLWGFWPEALWPAVCLIWGTSMMIFLAFPFYAHRLNRGGKRIGFVFFDFGQGALQLFVWGIALLGILFYSVLSGEFTWAATPRWLLLTFILVLVLSIDLTGSTPVFKSGLHEDRYLKVTIDETRCKGIGFCESVCPRDCYELAGKGQTVSMPPAARCVQCGACIVQCPADALFFTHPSGKILDPETVRRFKLNLMGKRLK
jgi:NAD-dependent dihydropyrimidine dehydrogenase PreA subunit